MPLWAVPPAVLAQGDNTLSRRWWSAIPDVISSLFSAIRGARDRSRGRGCWKACRSTNFWCVHRVPDSTVAWSARTRRILGGVVLAIGQRRRPKTRSCLGVARWSGRITLPPRCSSVLELSLEIGQLILE
jgi:hypothetical protein